MPLVKRADKINETGNPAAAAGTLHLRRGVSGFNAGTRLDSVLLSSEEKESLAAPGYTAFKESGLSESQWR